MALSIDVTMAAMYVPDHGDGCKLHNTAVIITQTIIQNKLTKNPEKIMRF